MATRRPGNEFALFVGQRGIKSSLGTGVDGLELPDGLAEQRGDRIDLRWAGAAHHSVAQFAPRFLDPVFDGFGIAVRFVENQQRLPPLGLAQLKSPGEILHAALGKGFIRPWSAARGLGREKHG